MSSSDTMGICLQIIKYRWSEATNLSYNTSIFTVATTYLENVGSGWLSSLIRLVLMLIASVRVRLGQQVTS